MKVVVLIVEVVVVRVEELVVVVLALAAVTVVIVVAAVVVVSKILPIHPFDNLHANSVFDFFFKFPRIFPEIFTFIPLTLIVVVVNSSRKKWRLEKSGAEEKRAQLCKTHTAVIKLLIQIKPDLF